MITNKYIYRVLQLFISGQVAFIIDLSLARFSTIVDISSVVNSGHKV